LLFGAYMPTHSELPPLLRNLRPVGRTRTFLIYDFSDAGGHAQRDN